VAIGYLSIEKEMIRVWLSLLPEANVGYYIS